MASNATVYDRNLITKSFKLMCTGIENVKIRDHLNKDLYYNFFSTAPGDNRYINTVPQYSPATDPRYSKFMASQSGGMGSQYKRLIDDNASLLTITAGVTEFTGMLDFIANMFDPVAAIQATKGRSPSAMFYIGQGLGTIAFWPIQLISIGVSFLYFLMDVPRNQFYYVKPAMGMYLNAATNLLNDIATSKGFIKPILAMHKPVGAPINGIDPSDADLYQEELSRLNSMFPDSINKDGTIDLIRLVSKGTRKYRQFLDELEQLNDDESIQSVQDKFDAMNRVLTNIQFGSDTLAGSGYSLSDYLKKELDGTGKYRSNQEADYSEEASAYLSQTAYQTPQDAQTTPASMPSATASLNFSGAYGTAAGVGDNTTEAQMPGTSSTAVAAAQSSATSSEDQVTDKSWAGQVLDQVTTAWHGGMDAITWRVEHMGSVTDSFSHSTETSPLAEKFNSKVRAATNLQFDLAGGKTGIGLVDDITHGISDLVQGVAASMSVGNIALALANKSFINVPDHWADSSVSLHKETYRFRFDATYAHPYSQLTDIWVPFSLLAPLFMPAAAGPSAYTSPFLVKVFSKARSIIRVGLVDSATITMGDGVGGWTRGRSPLNMTVDLSIVDLEKLVALPISRSIGLLDLTNPASAMKNMMSDMGKYNDWLTRISSMDYLDTVLKWNKMSNRLTRSVKSIENTFSASNVAGMVNSSIVGDIGKIWSSQFPR